MYDLSIYVEKVHVHQAPRCFSKLYPNLKNIREQYLREYPDRVALVIYRMGTHNRLLIDQLSIKVMYYIYEDIFDIYIYIISFNLACIVK